MSPRGVVVIAALAIVVVGVSCTKDDREPVLVTVNRPPAGDVSDAGDVLDVADDRRAPDASIDVPLGACSGQAGRTLRTLMVGNSQIYYQNLPKLLSDLSESGPRSCPRIAAEPFTRGGQNLMRLWEEGDSQGRKLADVLAKTRYDVVVIAESIDLVELPPPKTQFVEYANIMIDAIRASGARPILYATPYSDQEGHTGFVEMAEPQLALGKERAVTVAAGGLAWLRVWKELPSVVLHHADHSHPGPKGSLVSAMVIYSAITRATPIGLTTEPPIDCVGPCPKVTEIEGAVFQNAAWEEAKATSLR